LSQKGLCGGFNSQLLKYARLMAESELSEGRDFRILALGERSLGSLGRAYPSAVLPAYAGYAPPMELADYIDRLVAHLEFLRTEHGFVEIRIFYQSFRSAVQQLPTSSVIWPMSLRAMPEDVMHPASSEVVASLPVTYEPDFASIRARAEASMLQAALYRILLHHDTSEHGARMTAMENATQAAGEMIRKLTLQYNRSRQAAITTELIEIISGAEALA
jgi:F-type H+-transporting ATPase subunit gamma